MTFFSWWGSYHYYNAAPKANADCFNACEDTKLIIDAYHLLNNDTDANYDKLTITGVSGAVNGTVSIVNGQVHFMPAANYTGPASFIYTISDGKGGTSQACVTLNVCPVNDRPDAIDDVINNNVQGVVTISTATILANDKDVDGDKLTVTSVQAPTNGTVQLVNGQVIFTPTPGYSGPASFTYTVSDGKGGTDTAKVTFNVQPVNGIPDAIDDAIGNVGRAPVTIDPATLLGNDKDPDGNPLTITSVQQPLNGTVALVNGKIVFTPTPGYVGPASFTYTISDGKGGTDTAKVTLNVVNQRPDAVDDNIGTVPFGQPVTITPATLLGNDTDPENDTFTITSVQNPTNGTVALVNGEVVFTPAPGYSGPATFTYTITDSRGATDTATVTLNVGEKPNTTNADDDNLGTVPFGTATTIAPATLLGNDEDPDGDTFTITAVGNPTNGTVTLVNGSPVFTPTPGYSGPATFTYTITDSRGATDTATVTLNVGEKPNTTNADDDNLGTVPFGTATTIAPATLLGNDEDPDGDTFTITSVQNPTNGTVALVNGEVVFTPAPGYSGPATFTYTITDSRGATDTATVTLNVGEKPNTTNADDDNLGTVPFGQAAIIPAGVFTANDEDPDGDTFTITSVQNPTNGTVALVNGEVVFTPAPGYSGPATFTYTITDSRGATDTATVTLNVGEKPNTTNADDDNLGTVPFGTATTIAPATLLGNDEDPDGDTFTITAVGNPTNGTVTLVNGSPVFTPTPGYSGPATFTYTITDSRGATDTATVTLNVGEKPNTTNADDDNLGTVPFGQAAIIPAGVFTANDEDPDGDTFTITSVQNPTNGTVALVNGEVVFTPAPGYSGPATFTYTITDSRGATDTATVTLNVGEKPNTTNADDDNLGTVPFGQAAIIPAGVFTANDEDPDGDTFTITSVQNPTNGTVALVNGEVVFTPAPGYSGPATFTYTITDSRGATDTATVTLNVGEKPNTTNADDDNLGTVPFGTATTIAPATLLGNDEDPDGDTFTITAVGNPTNGTVTLVNGSPVFTPTPGYSGPATFTYTITDSRGATDTATVTLNVGEKPNTTNADDDNLGTVPFGTATTIAPATLLGNDEDPDGDTFTITAVGNPTNGTVTLVNGSPVFTPTPGYSGPATFTYTITDSRGATDTATVTLNVDKAPNLPPDAVDDNTNICIEQNTPYVFTSNLLLANDTDPNGDALTVVNAFGAIGGTVKIDRATGAITFTPTPGFVGDASFNYAIVDPSGFSDIAKVTLCVLGPKPNTTNADDDNLGTVPFGTATTIAPATLLGNDEDPDGDTFTITAVGNPTNGTVTLVNGSPVFTPTPGYSGPATFTYTITDSRGATDTATVTLNVDKAPNLPPDAVDDNTNICIEQNTPYVFTSNLLLANDTDPNGDALTVVNAFGAIGGTVKIDRATGAITFTPTPGFVGDASFNYAIVDPSGFSDIAKVTLCVLGPKPNTTNADDDNLGTVPFGTATTIAPATLLGNDEDPDGDTFTITAVGNPTNGTVTLVNGSPVFTPTPGYSGPATFTYTITDSRGATDTATVTLNVGEKPNTTNADDDNLGTVPFGTATTIAPATLLGNDEDPDGDTFTITAVGNPTNGTVTLVNGSPVFTPTPGYSGPATFTYTITDSRGATDTATVTLNVGEKPNTTNADDDNLGTVPFGTATTIAPATLLGNDEDPDGDTFTITAVGNPTNGTVTLVNGSPVFTPTPGYSGPATFTYTITDSRGATDTATVTLNVGEKPNTTNADDDNLGTVPFGTATTIAPATLLGNDEDPDGDTFTITAVGNPTNGTVTLVNGSPVFTPTPGYSGPATFTYTITDSRGATDTATVTLNVGEKPNTTNADDDNLGTVPFGTATTIAPATLLGNDEDPDGDTFTITAVGNPTNGTVTLVNGSPVFTPTPGYSGPATFTYTITDSRGATDTATVTLNVGEKPNTTNADDDNLGTVPFGQAAIIPAGVFTANDEDPDGDTFTITSVQNPTNGTVALVNGEVVFTPAPGYSGPATFTYTITDSRGATDTATVTLNVGEKPNTTNADDDNLGTVPFGQAAIIPAGVFTANDEDPDGDTFTITSVQNPTNGTVALVNGEVVFTPAPGYSGPATFTYTITDSRGATDTATVTLNVGEKPNGIPDAIDDAIGNVGRAPVTIDPATLLGNDKDPDGNPLTITSVQQPLNGTVALVNGKIVFTPTPGYVGPASFTYTISDGKGGTDTAKVTLNVVNQRPDAVDDNIGTVPFGQPVTITPATLLGNDTDPENDTFTITSVQNPTNGTVTLVNGSPVFTPTPGYSGPATFTYTISDGKGGTDTATVTLNVGEKPNGIPDAIDDAIGNVGRAPVTIDPATLLGNDKDPDGNPLTITSVQQPLNGTVALVNGKIVFTPTPGYVGPASFTYTISDGKGGTDTAKVTLNVINAGPDAVDDKGYNAISGTPFKFTPATLLANDKDADGDNLTIISVSNAVNGTVSIVNGEVVFTPKAGYCGTASFSYTISDGKGGTDTANVSLNVEPKPIVGNDYDNTLCGNECDDKISGLGGHDTLYGNGGNDHIDGGSGNDKLIGGTGNDSLIGGLGNDTLWGESGHDTLLGGSGCDTLIGGDGNDTLVGGEANDCMWGGLGADVFKWSLADVAASGVECDTVKDFSISQGDKLDLRDLLQGEKATASALDNYLHFEVDYHGNTTIYIDKDGKFGDNNKADYLTTNIHANVDQKITIECVNLASGCYSDAQVIQNLLNKGVLITD